MKTNYKELEGEVRLNKKGEVYSISKQCLLLCLNKYFFIVYTNGNLQMATYEQIKRGTCYDVVELKKQKRLKTEEKLRERNKLIKKANQTTEIPHDLKSCNVLSVDLSTTSTGLAYSQGGQIVRWKTIKADDHDHRVRAYKIIVELVSILEKGQIDTVILEDVYLGLNSNILVMLSEIRGMLIYHLQRLGIRLVLVPAVYWKGRLDNIPLEREEQKEYTKALFFERTGEDPDTDDVADAYCMLGVCLENSSISKI